MPTECRPVDLPGCVRSKELTKLFSATFAFLKNVLLKFGFQVSLGELGYNKTILSSYKSSFKDFDFVLSAVHQLEDMINSENEIDHEKLVKTSDTRPKPKCEDILNVVEACNKNSDSGNSCLSEMDARALIKYMILHYIIDTKQPIKGSVIEGSQLIDKRF